MPRPGPNVTSDADTQPGSDSLFPTGFSGGGALVRSGSVGTGEIADGSVASADLNLASVATALAARGEFTGTYAGKFLEDSVRNGRSSLASPALPAVMSSPPTITSGLAFGSTSISSPQYVHLEVALTSDVAAGVSSLPLRAKVTAGRYIIGSGATAETVAITAVSGSANPYTATLSTPLTNAHAAATDLLATAAVRFSGSALRSRTISGNAPSDFSYSTAATTGSNGGTAPAFGIIDFVTDSTKVEFDCLAGAGPTFLVDGQLVSASPTGFPYSSGDRWWLKVDFAGVRKMRRITVIQAPQCARIALDTYATVSAGPPPMGPRVAILSDSYGQQGSTTLGYGGPFLDACLRLGWYDLYLSAVGGTGYLNSNTTYTTFRGRVASDILAVSPDVIYNAGGLNDQGRQTGAVLQAEALALFQQERAASPKAWIIADSVWTPDGSKATDANYLAVRDAVKAALAQIAGPWLFIDNLTGGWVCSDGRSYAGAGQFQTGNGKGALGSGSLVARATAGSGGTFSAGTYYYVSTVTTASGEGTKSPEVSATVAANGTITLALGSMAGGTGAKVYRGTSSGAQDTLVSTATLGGTLVDTGGGSAATPPVSDTTATAGATPGNADYYIADGTHPSRAGSDFLATTRAEVLARVLRTSA